MFSKNHRMTEAGKDVWRSSDPISLLKQVQLPKAMSRELLNTFTDGDSTTLPGNLCQCLVTYIVQGCFLMLRGNLVCFSLCTLCLLLLSGTT